jgi:murein DD-endopeptidase MepM/ murein hydrolase activator NlpD
MQSTALPRRSPLAGVAARAQGERARLTGTIAERVARAATAPLSGFALAACIALAAMALLGADAAPLRRLAIPVEGVRAGDLRNTFADPRAGQRHGAIDIPAAAGTPVRAADDGTLVQLGASDAGGLAVYQLDPGERFAYHYAHLDRYAEGVREGMPLRRGDLIGYVGASGDAPSAAPHLHFAVFRLGPQKDWSRGVPVDPFDALH